MKIRHHGDFHLGQVLIAKDDAYILDFEGEPRRTLDERRAKAPAARDVAGFLRSIDYAVERRLDRAPDLTPEERATLDARDARMGRAAGRGLLGVLSRNARDSAALAGGRGQAAAHCSISSCWRRRSTKSNTS